MSGRLYVGTSGFAYPDWTPEFYPSGTRPSDLLRRYAERLPACELNNTFYRQPSVAAIDGWLAATPSTFRFAVKAQRGGSLRALFGDDPVASVAWLTEPLARFGDRLGAVLFRVPAEVEHDEDRLRALLAAWPMELPLSLEFRHPSWHREETFALLRAYGAVLCTTELDTSAGDPAPPEAPAIGLTGSFAYLRLRRESYTPAELVGWADRIVPVLERGSDAYVFFRHDATGLAATRALTLSALVADRENAGDAAGQPGDQPRLPGEPRVPGEPRDPGSATG